MEKYIPGLPSIFEVLSIPSKPLLSIECLKLKGLLLQDVISTKLCTSLQYVAVFLLQMPESLALVH